MRPRLEDKFNSHSSFDTAVTCQASFPNSLRTDHRPLTGGEEKFLPTQNHQRKSASGSCFLPGVLGSGLLFDTIWLWDFDKVGFLLPLTSVLCKIMELDWMVLWFPSSLWFHKPVYCRGSQQGRNPMGTKHWMQMESIHAAHGSIYKFSFQMLLR